MDQNGLSSGVHYMLILDSRGLELWNGGGFYSISYISGLIFFSWVAGSDKDLVYNKTGVGIEKWG